MSISRRQLLKTTALGGASLAFTPSFNHLMAAPASDQPHRFIFIRKSNGNLTQQFGLPSFSSDELTLISTYRGFHKLNMHKQCLNHVSIPRLSLPSDGKKEREQIELLWLGFN